MMHHSSSAVGAPPAFYAPLPVGIPKTYAELVDDATQWDSPFRSRPAEPGDVRVGVRDTPERANFRPQAEARPFPPEAEDYYVDRGSSPHTVRAPSWRGGRVPAPLSPEQLLVADNVRRLHLRPAGGQAAPSDAAEPAAAPALSSTGKLRMVVGTPSAPAAASGSSCQLASRVRRLENEVEAEARAIEKDLALDAAASRRKQALDIARRLG
ncbi:hypothetical protein DIPPA_20141, partial [Diplonema papillatum]